MQYALHVQVIGYGIKERADIKLGSIVTYKRVCERERLG